MKPKTSPLLLMCVLAGCSPGSMKSPTSPTAAEAPRGAFATSGPLAFFPDRAEAYQFRLQLEDLYRSLGYPAGPTYVNPEGSVIWITEYVRYRTTGCSSQQATSNVNFMIDNLNSLPPPGCGGSAGFPERPESLTFRTAFLEPKYRDGLRTSLESLYVNAEGDVIWTTEYLRYRDSGCSHADATARVNQAVRNPNMGAPPDCGGSGSTAPGPGGPAPQAPQARFDVLPNAGTNVNAPQCSVRATGGNNNRNRLLCTFDATSSTPRPGITSYEWNIDGQDNQTDNDGERLQNTTLRCGSFGDPDDVGKAFEKNVRLTVRAPGGTNSTQKSVTFIKTAPC
jgi:hypothetical protein